MEKVTHIQIKYPDDNISDPIPIEAEAENVIYHPEPNVNVDLSSVITDINTHLANMAPIDHASTETIYGIGTSTEYGHVKISDSYTAVGSADSGLVPSQKALSDGLITKAPYNHASNTTFFGVATDHDWGHVKLVDVIPQEQEEQAIIFPGEVPTPTAVREAIVQAINEEKDRVETENINKINIGTETTYNSHFINWETDDYVLNLSLSGDKESLSLNEKVNNEWEQLWKINMASLAEMQGTGNATKYGHVKVSDSYTATGTAANGLVPSQQALSNGLNNVTTIMEGLFYTTVNRGIKSISLSSGSSYIYNVTVRRKKSNDYPVSVELSVADNQIDHLQMSVAYSEAPSNTTWKFYILLANYTDSTVTVQNSTGVVQLDVLWANGDYISAY